MITVLLITLLRGHSLIAEEATCRQSRILKHELSALLREFKQDCGHYPERLVALIERPSDCAAWGGSKGPYLVDKLSNRAMIGRLDYSATPDDFKLNIPGASCE